MALNLTNHQEFTDKVFPIDLASLKGCDVVMNEDYRWVIPSSCYGSFFFSSDTAFLGGIPVFNSALKLRFSAEILSKVVSRVYEPILEH